MATPSFPIGELAEVLLIVVLSLVFAALSVFVICWFAFGIWGGTSLGRSMMAGKLALMVLVIVEALGYVDIHFGGILKMVSWTIIGITAVIQTSAMLWGRGARSEKVEEINNGDTG